MYLIFPFINFCWEPQSRSLWQQLFRWTSLFVQPADKIHAGRVTTQYNINQHCCWTEKSTVEHHVPIGCLKARMNSNLSLFHTNQDALGKRVLWLLSNAPTRQGRCWVGAGRQDLGWGLGQDAPIRRAQLPLRCQMWCPSELKQGLFYFFL